MFNHAESCSSGEKVILYMKKKKLRLQLNTYPENGVLGFDSLSGVKLLVSLSL